MADLPAAGAASTSGSGLTSKGTSTSAAPNTSVPTDALNKNENVIDKVKYVRITTHGKMKTWIANSLAFFEDVDQDKSLVFHTLPQSIDPSAYPSPSSPQPREPASGKDTRITISSHAASGTTSLIPRLLSVVEIIKREFMKRLEETKSTRMRGLEQYNELGNAEALGVVVSDVAAEGEGEEEGDEVGRAEKQRSERILQALSGKNYPRQSQTPYMRVTLSLKERPDLVERGATYQPPAIRKLSKSGKARAKKRTKMAQALALEEAKKATQEARHVEAAVTTASTKKGGESTTKD